MDHRNQITSCSLVFLVIAIFSSAVSAQDNSGKYRFTPAPDVWYNSVDGVRLGIRVLGEQEGSFKDGPHRLDAGIWLGTNIPDNPVSYYASFIEPIKSISDFGEEGSIQLVSSIRTGFSQHQLSLNKRWQDGFNELNYKEIAVSFSQEKMFDQLYRPYSVQWSSSWKSLLGLNLMTHNESEENTFEGILDIQQNVNPESQSFFVSNLELWKLHKINKNYEFGIRFFSAFLSENTAPEFIHNISYAQPRKWLDNGVSRARGTIPQNWVDNGFAHVSGSGNLRGYTDTILSEFSTEPASGFGLLFTINTELEFPNPISKSLKKGILGEFVFLKSYTFLDAGYLRADLPVLFDAGVGLQFSFNIPDFLGKPRGFAIRYEVPFWISEPDAGDSNFEFRNLIGFGAVISL